MPPKRNLQNAVFFETEYVIDSVDGEPQFNKIPYDFHIRMDPEALQAYADGLSKESKSGLTYAEQEFIKTRIRSVEYLDYLKKHKSANQDPSLGPVATEKGGMMLEHCVADRNQTASSGCWSVAMEQLLKSRGVFVPQEIVRQYRPEMDPKEGFRPGDMEKLTLITGGDSSIKERANLLMELLPNTAVQEVKAGFDLPFDQKDKESAGKLHEVADYIFNYAKDSISTRRSPVSLNLNGHFITILGFDPSSKTLTYQDPMGGRDPIQTATAETLLLDANQYGSVDMTMTSLVDLDRSTGKIPGFEENFSYDPDGHIVDASGILFSDPAYPNGYELATQADEPLEALTSEISISMIVPKALEETAPYERIIPPAVSGAKQISSDEDYAAELAADAQRERQYKELEYMPPEPMDCTAVMQEIIRLNDRLARNSRASESMTKFRRMMNEFTNDYRNGGTVDKNVFLRDLNEALGAADAYRQEKDQMLANGGSLSSTQLHRLKTINYITSLRDLVKDSTQTPTKDDIAGRLLGAKLYNAVWTGQKDKRPLCNQQSLHETVRATEQDVYFKTLAADEQKRDQSLRTQSSRFCREYTAAHRAFLHEQETAEAARNRKQEVAEAAREREQNPFVYLRSKLSPNALGIPVSEADNAAIVNSPSAFTPQWDMKFSSNRAENAFKAHKENYVEFAVKIYDLAASNPDCQKKLGAILGHDPDALRNLYGERAKASGKTNLDYTIAIRNMYNALPENKSPDKTAYKY